MKNLISRLLAVALVLSLASFALARGAPTSKQNITAEQMIAPSAETPIVIASVPPLTTGYDVICNITNVADTSAESRLSTPVDWRSINANHMTASNSLPAPRIVLLS